MRAVSEVVGTYGDVIAAAVTGPARSYVVIEGLI